MPDSISLLEKARRVLEWNAVLEALAGLTVSIPGAERCRSLELAVTLDDARCALIETTEMAALEAHAGGCPLASFSDIRPAVRRAAKGALLQALDFRDIQIVLHVVSEIYRYLAARQFEAPSLSHAMHQLDPLGPLISAIERCIDEEGNVRESATAALLALTHHANALKQRMRTKLEHILGSLRFAALLQEPYFAQRENRYVLPIKAERKGDVPGIVHDVSASGATVFIEPRDLVDLNNDIKEADLAVEREVRRILQDLSTQAGAQEEALLVNLELLALLDCIHAKARLGGLMEASAPVLNTEGRLRLKQARHPLLVLNRRRDQGAGKAMVVANDIELRPGQRVLVISGPNAGGKTVTLKIVGLFALMVRAGLLIPCAEGSEMAFFAEVYADIGDAQDLTRDLSSFSAHMTDMIALLREAAPGALVLLDEPVTSTDPAEGAALAQALLVRLAERGFTVVATTHYNPLKALAQSHPGFAGASVEFNVSTLSPTYRLILGMPGGSSAIDIAGRLGMDEEILDEAVCLVNTQERAVERLLEDLQETRRKLDEDSARVAAMRAESEAAASLQKELAERQAALEKETRKTARKKVTAEVLRARAEVQSVMEDLKTDKRLVKVRETKARLAGIEQTAQARLAPAGDYRPVDQLRIGDRVEILGLGTSGVLLEVPSGKKRVRVRVGESEMSVAVSRLAGVENSDEDDHPVGRADKRRPAAGVQMSRGVQEVDVRGKSAEEALEMVEGFLDKTLLSGTQLVRVIHGHGTGRLRQVLREYLKHSPYVSGFRSGERPEGGDGVTVATLQDR